MGKSMKNRLLLVAALCVSLLSAGFAYRAQPTRVKWEYHAERFSDISEKKLNELGEQGWEFVGAANEDGLNEFIFKRVRQ